ncbi:MAG: hypothetical protein HY606_07390 [Planctomycetes bacterium]|nr:hypothetical protein [Planctomycetota bacterium]
MEDTMPTDELEAKIKKLEDKFRLKILYKGVPAPTGESYVIEEGSGMEDNARVSKVLSGIDVAFSRYPLELIKLAGISSIAVVKKLEGPERVAPEMADYGNHVLYFNCSIVAFDPIQNKIDYVLFWTYIAHHGFGHMIDYAIKGASSSDDAEWKKLNDSGVDYGSGAWGVKEHDAMCFVHPAKGFVNKYSMSSMQEDKAEIFTSLFMREIYLRVSEWAVSDKALERKLNYMKGLLSAKCEKLDQNFWNKTLNVAGLKKNSTWLTPVGWLPVLKSGVGGGQVERVEPGRERVVFGVMLTGKTVGTLDVCYSNDTAWFVGHVGDVLKKFESPAKGWEVENCKSVTAMSLWGVWAAPDGKKVWVCGGDSRKNGASIWYSEDGGKKWKVQFNSAETYPDRSLLSTDHMNKFFFFDEKNGFAVGGLSDNTGIILKTSDGKTWQTVYKDWTVGTDDELRSIWFADAQHGCAVGHYGAIVMTCDGGKTWSKVSSGTEQYLYTVRSLSKDVWFISAASGIVLRSTDGGKKWEQIDAGEPSEHLYALAVCGRKIWVGGENGAIYVSSDNGENWEKQQSNVAYPIHSIFMLNDKVGAAACASNTANLGAILFTYSGGE